MASFQPSRLLCHRDGNFFVIEPGKHNVHRFDIISYRWGEITPKYDCGIEGVNWRVTISSGKLEDIKRLMIAAKVQYLWVDCVCINQDSETEKSIEIARMYNYYQQAEQCHILIDMYEVWQPQGIIDDLRFLGHILAHMKAAAIASQARLTQEMVDCLSEWEKRPWTFPLDKSTVKSAAIEMGVLNCYSTCINYVKSLFDNPYFSRVWTFQEMLLGNNITMWGMNDKNISRIGEFRTWMDLAIDSRDKAHKLSDWIDESRVEKTAAVQAVLRIVNEDKLSLGNLQTVVRGIDSARTDILSGGRWWWRDNYKGISNVFSAVSIRPRTCGHQGDIFKGLLGVFSGLFTPDEIESNMAGDDMERISFAFFKQLSIKTGRAWTKLAISREQRSEWDWIPMVVNNSTIMTTDCFAGVVNLGELEQEGIAKTLALTGVEGVPRKYMRILLSQKNRVGFQFYFKGCNCGKKMSTGMFKKPKPILTSDQPLNVHSNQIGRTLVQCATILATIMDPGCNIIRYRKSLLSKLRPNWITTDPNARPGDWIDRCVSGTSWEDPDPQNMRTHNRSMNYIMNDITSCESRLENDSTARISCEVTVDCGCTIIAPFSLIFEAITAVEGSFLGDVVVKLDNDNRIIIKDGVGLVQAGDVGRAFNLVAFGGNVDAHKSYSIGCRDTKSDKPVVPKLKWPSSRALVGEEFSHGTMDMMRDYGYVKTGGSGNLLICRNKPFGDHKIIGVCIDEKIQNKNGFREVTIR